MPELHAKFSPSALGYLEKCPRYKSEGTSFAAEEGTMMHEAAETGDLSKLNEEQRAQVELCLSYVDSLDEEYESIIFNEEEVHVEDVTWGTADVMIVTGDHVDVVDFKFGRNPVPDAEINLQGWAYLIGAWNSDMAKHCTTGTVHFLLPRRDEVSSHKFTRSSDYERMLDRIGTIVARAEKATEDQVFSGPHCRYCSRKVCPAMVGHAMAIAPNNLPDVKIDAVSLRDPNNISKLLDMRPIFDDFFKQVTKRAMEMVDEDGLEVPGYEERVRSAPRTIKDVTEAWTVVEQHGVDLQDFLDACSIKLGALDTAVKKAAGKNNQPKGETVRSVHEELTMLGIETSEGEIRYLKKLK